MTTHHVQIKQDRTITSAPMPQPDAHAMAEDLRRIGQKAQAVALQDYKDHGTYLTYVQGGQKVREEVVVC